MAKPYLTLEDAAALAGIGTDELRRLREKGELRGFADRGTWKFRQEDIEELARSRQADSDPDVPMMADEDEPATGGSSVVGGSSIVAGSSILQTDDDVVGEQPTVIRGSALDDDEPLGGTSDSDVRLILDDSLTADNDADGGPLPDSDSDVRLAGDSGPSLLDEGSDSDVKLVGTDPDIPLLADEGGSDSDVRLVPQGTARNASESDIRLAPTDEDEETLRLDEPDEQSALADDAPGNSIGLAAESGISLESLADSGISLESGDSGIALEGADSGISLGSLADSGISLADEDDDGITLAQPQPKGRKDKNKTVPATRAAATHDELDDTNLEVPAAEDSEFELAMEDDDQADTSVILFDEEDEVDQHSATVVRKRGGDDLDLEAETFDVDEAEFGGGEEFDDELVVAEDVVGEDDELDFVEAGDEDFDDEFVSGESQAEFIAPAGRMAAPVEQEWGTGTFVGLCAATALMAVCGMVMFDLVRSMWAWNDPSGFNSAILNSLRGFF